MPPSPTFPRIGEVGAPEPLCPPTQLRPKVAARPLEPMVDSASVCSDEIDVCPAARKAKTLPATGAVIPAPADRV